MPIYLQAKQWPERPSAIVAHHLIGSAGLVMEIVFPNSPDLPSLIGALRDSSFGGNELTVAWAST